MQKRVVSAKKILRLIAFTVIAFIVGTSIYFVSTTQTKTTTATRAAEANFDQYCENGIYYVTMNGKKTKCGRAPNCDGWSFDQAQNTGDYVNDGECWHEKHFSNNRCGGGIDGWCVNIDNCVADDRDVPLYSLEQRLTGNFFTPPTPTFTPAAATPTHTPTPTPTSITVTTPTRTPTPTNIPASTNTPTPTKASAATPTPTNTAAVPDQPRYAACDACGYYRGQT